MRRPFDAAARSVTHPALAQASRGRPAPASTAGPAAPGVRPRRPHAARRPPTPAAAAPLRAGAASRSADPRQRCCAVVPRANAGAAGRPPADGRHKRAWLHAGAQALRRQWPPARPAACFTSRRAAPAHQQRRLAHQRGSQYAANLVQVQHGHAVGARVGEAAPADAARQEDAPRQREGGQQLQRACDRRNALLRHGVRQKLGPALGEGRAAARAGAPPCVGHRRAAILRPPGLRSCGRSPAVVPGAAGQQHVQRLLRGHGPGRVVQQPREHGRQELARAHGHVKIV